MMNWYKLLIIHYVFDLLLSLYWIKILVLILGDVVVKLMYCYLVLKKKRKKVK